jgi:UDP-glucose 6-dehydrogenase
VKVLAFDPAYGTNSSRPALENVCFASSALDCIQKSDAVILATSWPEFNTIAPSQWSRSGNHQPRTVIDCWRAVKFLRDEPGVHYIALGEGFQ